MNKKLFECPCCSKELIIKEYECPKCKVNIRGSFAQDKFSKLSEEDRDFIEIFVMKRGNFKEIEKVLDISYPTVRNKLDKVIEALGHQVDASIDRLEILKLLDEGEITSEEATAMLEDLRR